MINLNDINTLKNLDKGLTIVRKHGAVAILAIWVGFLQWDSWDMKNKLYNCYLKEQPKATDRNWGPLGLSIGPAVLPSRDRYARFRYYVK